MCSSLKPDIHFDEMTIGPETVSKGNTFDVFQEVVADFPVRCTFEYSGSDPFQTQWISTQSGKGSAIRWSCAAHTTRRTENDIADSIPSGYGILFAVSGGAMLTHKREEILVSPGNAVLYNLDQPMQVDMLKAAKRDFLLITLPHDILPEPFSSNDGSFSPRLLSHHTPLLQCVDHLACMIAEKNADEFRHVFRACERLITAELLARDHAGLEAAQRPSVANDLFERILSVIEMEIGNPELSPQWLADKFGISVRYIHKLFASRDLTCQGYITTERLSHAKQDLSASANTIRISALAYRWGFSDSSSFGRAFKSRFGLAPGQYRSKRRA
ncbi:helix-turn-helix domain-containing protein [Hyphomicrobium facile]|uniref:AraC-type DNA-binding protein n=1 Tax=Hyphomicrobium facile TaxID=51670 RepID=A0A1I7NFM5_9HYPH|nr:helix-turn-helix domain-containing protein [Hyphomicrobium facile]SFV33477.1 AraC-type DNA-binding protein [Hyphomicrobium facile]